MEKHINVLGWLYIIFNVLGLFLGILLFWIIAGGGLISGDPEAIFITGIVATAVAGFLTILSVPGIIGGIFLLQWKPWARILVLILGFLNLLDIPLGTILGIYTIWVLMKDETVQLFKAKTGS
ncbi:MAG: hypothetical protein AMJ90_05140 [candidate division Zixibacteria bacterium SM23_73_2]|nr:MAG: hypothetical protein AMJ90_05140 [candidate division Zixibacteria bacterium SM23_73_2]